MMLEWGDLVEYEVVTRDGESKYFECKDEAEEFFNNEENDALILNRVGTEMLETKE